MTYNKYLLELKNDVDNLLSGIDPKTGLAFQADTILNDSYNKKIFYKLSKLLNRLLETDNKGIKDDFCISKEQKDQISLSEEPISISKFTYRINEKINTQEMKKIRGTQITEWLLENGYLEIEYDSVGNPKKVVTSKAVDIGISCMTRKNTRGIPYNINVYNEKAQSFILEHVNEMV